LEGISKGKETTARNRGREAAPTNNSRGRKLAARATNRAASWQLALRKHGDAGGSEDIAQVGTGRLGRIGFLDGGMKSVAAVPPFLRFTDVDETVEISALDKLVEPVLERGVEGVDNFIVGQIFEAVSAAAEELNGVVNKKDASMASAGPRIFFCRSGE
jgi:hypothetical protein